MYLQYSAVESNTLGLRVARGTDYLESFDPEVMGKEILSGAYDLVRIKMNGKAETLFLQLEKTGIPYQVFTVNYRNVREIPQMVEPLPDGISIREYEGTDEALLNEVLNQVVGTRGWPEYRSELMDKLVDPSRNRELSIAYFGSFHEKARPGGKTWFLHYKGNVAGIFMGEIRGEFFEGALYGILPAFRGMGLSKVIYQQMDRICLDHGIRFFRNDIHILNIPSQRSAVSSGLVPREIYFNIVLFPLLSHSLKEKRSARLTEEIPSEGVPAFLFGELRGILDEYFAVGFGWAGEADFKLWKGDDCVFSFPVWRKDEVRCTCRFFRESESLPFWAHVRLCRKE